MRSIRGLGLYIFTFTCPASGGGRDFACPYPRREGINV